MKREEWQQVKEILHTALDVPAMTAPAIWTRHVMTIRGLRRRGGISARLPRSCRHVHRRAGGRRAQADAAGRHPWSRLRPGTLPYRATDRRRGDGGSLPGSPGGRSVSQSGGGQSSPPRRVRRVCAAALRYRAPDSGPSGPSEYRQAAGRRHNSRRPPLLRDGFHRGHADRRVLRWTPAGNPRAGGFLSDGLLGGSLRAPESGDSPRLEAAKHSGHRGRRGQTAGFRNRETAGASTSWATPRRSELRSPRCRR